MSYVPDVLIEGLDHVQLAAPRGCEEEARWFFGELLGLVEVEKPDALRARGGVWFQAGAQQLHVGVAEPFAPATKAHPALRVQADALDGVRRFYSADPWGNRIELLAVASHQRG